MKTIWRDKAAGFRAAQRGAPEPPLRQPCSAGGPRWLTPWATPWPTPLAPSLASRTIALLGAVVLIAAGCAGGDGDDAPKSGKDVGPGGAPPGFWFQERDPSGDPGTAASERGASATSGLGYSDGYVPSTGGWTGLRIREGQAPPPAPLVFSSGHGSSAFALLPSGEVERRWHLEEDDPDLPPFEHPSQKAWRAIEPLPDGGLLAVHEGLCLLRLSADSKVKWSGAPRAHHDFVQLPGDRIAVLDREKVPLPGDGVDDRAGWLSEDGIAIVSLETGQTLRRMSLWDALLASRWTTLASEALVNTGLVEVGDGTGAIEKALDPLHANSIALDPRSGDAVIFLRDVGALLWVDLEQLKIVRVRVGPWVGAHDPQPIPGRAGWWALFDNYSSKGTTSSVSRIVATDGFTTEVLYEGSARDPFFSPVCGSIAPESGGWIVTETTQGRAFGLTAGGEIAWEFRSPFRIEERGLIAALLDMRRLPPAIGDSKR